MRVSRSLVTSALVILVAFLSGSATAGTPCSGPHTCVDLGGMSCEEELAEFLQTAEVVSIEDIGDGITKPHRVILKKGEHTCRAIFKTVDISSTDIAYTNRLESVFTDKYSYEVADGLKGLDLATLESKLDGLLSKRQIRAIESRRKLLVPELDDLGVLPRAG